MQKKRRTTLLILAALLVAVGVLREPGFITLSRYTFEYHSNISQRYESVKSSEPLMSFPNGMIVASRVKSGFADAFEEELGRQIRTKSGTYVSASLNQFDIEGAYWLPLYKKGRCVYRMQVRAAEEDAVRDSWISGEMDFNVEGVCSILTFKQALAKHVVQETMKHVEQ